MPSQGGLPRFPDGHDDVSRVFVANNEPPLAFSKKVKGYVPSPLDDERFNGITIQ